MGARTRTTGSRARRTWLVLLVLWSVLWVANRSLRRVRGGSMRPTLSDGDLVLTLPVRVPRRGEVVLVRDPRDPTHVQVKRVVGLPGETIVLRGGRLAVDGRWHRETYGGGGGGPDGRLTVPADHVAVLGDARDASTDSRAYGAVPLELVDRRVPLVVRPRPRWLRATPVPLWSVPEPDERSA